jgi:hypothetical protein
MILTNANGKPFDKPTRDEFGPGWKGTSEFLAAFHAYKDQVADCAHSSFDLAFQLALKK